MNTLRILLISNVPIHKENSLGNTFLNLLGGMEGVELASIYTRNGVPGVEIAEAFCITEGMLIKNLLKKTPAGMKVQQRGTRFNVQKTSGWQELLKFVKMSRWTVFFWIQDLVWKLGKWKSAELEAFVEEYDPDLVVATLLNSVCLNNLIVHVLSLSDAKFLLYAWDNNYSLKQLFFSPLRWIKRFVDRVSMRKLVSHADLLYVISEVQKKDYERYFRKICKIITKGEDFSNQPSLKSEYRRPLQIVFTGNIGLNRWKSLKMIADTLVEINEDGLVAQLRIYTATPLTKKMEKALNRGTSSAILGDVPAEMIPAIQKNADMLVHVEALDLQNRLKVRQSFSTKIVDYLKSARPILAVGPKDVASIDHLIRNDCAIVADNKAELERKLRSILEDPSELNRVARNAYECGRKHHNRQDIQQMLMRDLRTICGK